MEDLVTKTNEVLYEQYRTNKLQAASGAITPIDGCAPPSAALPKAAPGGRFS